MSTSSFSSSTQSMIRAQFGDRALFDEPLHRWVAWGIGGPADVLVLPKSEADLQFIADISKRENIPVTIIGTGTNLLVRDGGIRGIVVSLKDSFNQIEFSPKSTATVPRVRVGGGTSKPDLLKWAIDNNLCGLEFSSGVPGTIGGGIFMNAGTKYGSYGEILREIRLFDFMRGFRQIQTVGSEFSYRHQTLVKDTLVIWTEFELKQGSGREIQQEVDRIIAERAAKQPLDFPSCGSTFKNPEGYSAGRLIEKANLKGTKIGGAEISLKHANFFLNKGGATAKDVLSLIELTKKQVYDQFGVTLECEVIILGSD